MRLEILTARMKAFMNDRWSPLLCAFLAAPASLATAADAPSADTLKQVLTARLLELKPEGMSERRVLFESVKAGRASAGAWPFTVTLNVLDYGPGYPKNRYYGQTCLRQFQDAPFKLWLDDKGGWRVDGAMTARVGDCKDNPAEGVLAIPLASVRGSPAPAGTAPAVASAATPAGQMAFGRYECWANGQARLLMNFSTTAAGRYTGSDGKSGRYSLDAARRVSFEGGALDGVMPAGFTAVYHADQGRPTVSFRGRSGSEAAFCERVG